MRRHGDKTDMVYELLLKMQKATGKNKPQWLAARDIRNSVDYSIGRQFIFLENRGWIEKRKKRKLLHYRLTRPLPEAKAVFEEWREGQLA